MHSLPLFHRIAGQAVVVIGNGDMAAAKRRLVERAGGICCGEHEAARLAFVAIEDQGEAEAATARLKARGLLVNVADRPELCDFTLPSVLERGEVLVAVSTGGASAGLAKQLRLRLEQVLPTSLGGLARGLAEAREMLRRRWPDPAARRQAIDAALAQGGALDLFDSAAPGRIDAWLAGDGNAAPLGCAVTIAIHSSDPDELTLRQARLLGTADTIVHDADVPAAILARARADAVRLTGLDDTALPQLGLTVVLRTALRPAGEWFRYTRRAGHITAAPANAAGWLAFLAILAATVASALLAMRWAMQFHPLAGFIALPLILAAGIAAIIKLAVVKGRPVT